MMDQCKPVDVMLHELPAGSEYQLLKGAALQKALNTYEGMSGERLKADRLLLITLADGGSVIVFVRDYAGCEYSFFKDPHEAKSLRRFLTGDGA